MSKRGHKESNGVSSSEKNLPFRFVTAGSALKYGMMYELPEVIRNKGDGNAAHFYACLAYLCLTRVIDSKTVMSIPGTIFVESLGEDSMRWVVEKVTSTIVRGLKDKFVFSDFDELKKVLDQYSIPDWCFNFGEEFMKKYIPNMILDNEELIFIGKRTCDPEQSLLRVNVNHLVKNEEFLEAHGIERLASGYSEICGFDEQLKRIYMGLHSQKNYYAYYDLLSDNVVICRNRFHSFVSGSLFVITRDENLAIVIGDTEHRINSFSEHDAYEPRETYFLVRPNIDGSHFFVPYYLYFDGKRVQADRAEYEKILWEYMTRNLIESDFDFLSLRSSPKEKVEMPRKLSLNEIIETLEASIPSEKRCKNKNFILFRNILSLIEPYVDGNADISKVLYAVCEAGSLLDSNNGFPSENLYWRIKEIEFENKNSNNSLASLIQNYNSDILIETIINDSICDNKDFIETDEEVSVDEETFFNYMKQGILSRFRRPGKNGKIGTFYFADGEVKTHPISFEEGMFLGSQILPKINLTHETGIVSYDARTRLHYITCEHDISSEERLQIIKDFEIDSDDVQIVKQGKSFEEQRRINQYYYRKECKESFIVTGDESDFDDDAFLDEDS